MMERRKNARWGLPGLVRVKEEDMDAVEAQVQGNDISIGGLSFLSPVRPDPKYELELIIELPDKERFIFAKGKVAWQSDPILDAQSAAVKTGVSFNKIRDVDKERIFNYAYRFCKNELIKKWWEGLEPVDDNRSNEGQGYGTQRT